MGLEERMGLLVFDGHLRGPGWVSCLPQKVWEAYREGLFREWRVPGWVKGLRLPVSMGDPVNCVGLVPRPTFTDEAEWKKALRFFGINNNKKWAYIVLENGSVQFVFKFFGILRQETNNLPEDWYDTGRISEIRRMRQEFNLPVSYEGVKEFRYLFVISLRSYPAEQVKKIRRRVEDRLRKGDPRDIVRVAKLLGIK